MQTTTVAASLKIATPQRTVTHKAKLALIRRRVPGNNNAQYIQVTMTTPR